MTKTRRMLTLLVLVSALAPLHFTDGGLAGAERRLASVAQDDLLARARRLQAEVPLIDGHNDFAWEVREKAGGDLAKLDIAGPQPTVMTDLPGSARAGWAPSSGPCTSRPRWRAKRPSRPRWNRWTWCTAWSVAIPPSSNSR